MIEIRKKNAKRMSVVSKWYLCWESLNRLELFSLEKKYLEREVVAVKLN